MAAVAELKRGGLVEDSRDERIEVMLTAARSGDRKAMANLLRLSRPLLLRRLRYLLASMPATNALAEELAQEAMLRLIRALPSMRATTAPELRAWLFRVATNLAWDCHASWRTELKARRTHSETSGSTGHTSMGLAAADGEDTPEELRWVYETLEESTEVLSAPTRRVLQLRMDGATWAEAGRRIETTPGGARSRYRRAIARLRREFRKRMEELPAGVRGTIERYLGINMK